MRRYGDSVVTHQQRIAEAILSGPQHVDAVVALTSAATLGVYFAKLAAASPTTFPVVGFDQGLLLPIQSGEIDSIVVQNTRKIGQIAMQNVSAALRGKKVNGVTLVPPILLTRDNLDAPDIKSQWELAVSMESAMNLRSADSRWVRPSVLLCLVILAAIATGLLALRYRKVGPRLNDPSAQDGLSHDGALGWVVEKVGRQFGRGRKQLRRTWCQLLQQRGNLSDYQVQADLAEYTPSE